jgi:hypothetical protein
MGYVAKGKLINKQNMNNRNWKQLNIKQVAILYRNRDILSTWEQGFLVTLKENKFKVSDKQMSIVNKLLGKIGYLNSEEYYKNKINNRYSNIDAWTKIEYSK